MYGEGTISKAVICKERGGSKKKSPKSSYGKGTIHYYSLQRFSGDVTVLAPPDLLRGKWRGAAGEDDPNVRMDKAVPAFRPMAWWWITKRMIASAPAREER